MEAKYLKQRTKFRKKEVRRRANALYRVYMMMLDIPSGAITRASTMNLSVFIRSMHRLNKLAATANKEFLKRRERCKIDRNYSLLHNSNNK